MALNRKLRIVAEYDEDAPARFGMSPPASRRCPIKGFSAPAFANILNSSRSNEVRSRKSCMLWKGSLLSRVDHLFDVSPGLFHASDKIRA